MSDASIPPPLDEVRHHVAACQAVFDREYDGNLPTTREVLLWDDGDFSVEIFHTFQTEPPERLAVFHHSESNTALLDEPFVRRHYYEYERNCRHVVTSEAVPGPDWF